MMEHVAQPGFDEGLGEPPYALVLARSQSGGANFRSAATGMVVGEGGSGALINLLIPTPVN